MRITVLCERARWLGRFRSGEIHVFDSTGNVERTIPFNEADREMECVIKQREEGRDGPSAAVSGRAQTGYSYNPTSQHKSLEDSNLQQ
jgi:hypothetical protein